MLLIKEKSYEESMGYIIGYSTFTHTARSNKCRRYAQKQGDTILYTEDFFQSTHNSPQNKKGWINKRLDYYGGTTYHLLLLKLEVI